MAEKPKRPFHKERTLALLQELAGKFLSEEALRQSLITITRTEMSRDLGHVTFFISVLPESAEENALDFAKRKRTELREYIDKKAKIGRLPILDFQIDVGEKSRRRVDELLREDKNRKAGE